MTNAILWQLRVNIKQSAFARAIQNERIQEMLILINVILKTCVFIVVSIPKVIHSIVSNNTIHTTRTFMPRINEPLFKFYSDIKEVRL